MSRIFSLLITTAALAVTIAWAAPALGWYGTEAPAAASTGPAGVHPRLMQAYATAARQSAQLSGCAVSAEHLTGIGWKETKHATYPSTRSIDADGIVSPLYDIPDGKFHSLSNMMIQTYNWPNFGTDGDGDGNVDPQDVDDAVQTAATILCRANGYSSDPEEAIRRYNGSGPAAEAYKVAVLSYVATSGPVGAAAPDGLLESTAAFWTQAEADMAEEYDYISKPAGWAGSFFTWASSGPSATSIGGTSIGGTPPLPSKDRGPVIPISQTVVVRGNIRVHPDIAPNVQTMFAAAERDGIRLHAWGWRSTKRQAELRIINGCVPLPCSVPTATPGRSMHERGKALDITLNGKVISSRNTTAFKWLEANAARYGFFNLPSEPWHWSTNGK